MESIPRLPPAAAAAARPLPARRSSSSNLSFLTSTTGIVDRKVWEELPDRIQSPALTRPRLVDGLSLMEGHQAPPVAVVAAAEGRRTAVSLLGTSGVSKINTSRISTTLCQCMLSLTMVVMASLSDYTMGWHATIFLYSL